jgi:hypothetical protein
MWMRAGNPREHVKFAHLATWIHVPTIHGFDVSMIVK